MISKKTEKKKQRTKNNAKIIISKDSMQRGYKYNLTKKVGRSFHPEFKPELTPKQMLSLGVFGGKYFSSSAQKEFPASWFKTKKLVQDKEKSNPKLNFFQIKASKSLKYWQDKGWIHPSDPRGWFQWYCRYYMGRRHEDDERQIKRWKAMVRHIAQLTKNCRKGDFACRPKQRQALLHWAYDSRKM